jgi:hypothetical protein
MTNDEELLFLKLATPAIRTLTDGCSFVIVIGDKNDGRMSVLSPEQPEVVKAVLAQASEYVRTTPDVVHEVLVPKAD